MRTLLVASTVLALAGQRYQLEAGSIGFRPWAKLYDEQRKLVGTGLPAGCQRT
nr:hypothetical protein [Pseudomonas sp. SDI]